MKNFYFKAITDGETAFTTNADTLYFAIRAKDGWRARDEVKQSLFNRAGCHQDGLRIEDDINNHTRIIRISARTFAQEA